MCVIIVGWRTSEAVPIMVATNRDEAHERPTARAAFRDGSRILCGLDLRSGGSWFAVDRFGRFAAVSNLWQEGGTAPGVSSRGELPLNYLRDAGTPGVYLERIARERHRYGPFNLVVGDLDAGLWLLDSARGEPTRLEAGVHVIGNVRPDRRSTRVDRLRARARDELHRGKDLMTGFARMLRDPEPLDPGNSSERARRMSAPFICSPVFGTRATTLFRLDRSGEARFVERSFGPDGAEVEQRRFRFTRPRGIA